MPSDHPWHPRPRSPRESLKDQAGRQSQNRLILPSLIKPTTNQNDDFFDSIGPYETWIILCETKTEGDEAA